MLSFYYNIIYNRSQKLKYSLLKIIIMIKTKKILYLKNNNIVIAHLVNRTGNHAQFNILL